MDLYQKLSDDSKAALKQGDAAKLSVLRMLLSAVKMLEIEKNSRPADGDILQIVQRQIKQHRESIEQFEKGSRPDLAGKEKAELEMLTAYMPEPLTEDEVAAIVKEAVADTGAATKADMGKVMKAVIEKAKGRADGKLVNQLVMKLLK